MCELIPVPDCITNENDINLIRNIFETYNISIDNEGLSSVLNIMKSVTCNVIQESKDVLKYCNRNEMSKEDIEFAMERFMDKHMKVSIPPREVISESAELINLQSLDFRDLVEKSDVCEND